MALEYFKETSGKHSLIIITDDNNESFYLCLLLTVNKLYVDYNFPPSDSLTMDAAEINFVYYLTTLEIE